MISIPAPTNNLQDILEESLSPVDELLIDNASGLRSGDQAQEDNPPATLFNKYGYDEFIGFAGKRLLDRILQDILTHANWRTWHFADEFVAPGSDCYVGPYRLAQQIRPGVRKVEMDFKSLRTLELMDIYPDYRLVKRSATGKFEKQAVIVKDFTKLYALAHEYCVWENSPEYIPPERQYRDLILADKDLAEKLRRFDNYRRILECHAPGRKPGQTEPPMSHAAMIAIAVEDAQGSIESIETKEFSNTLAKTVSPNRVTRIPQGELNQDGSSRSGSAAGLGGRDVAVAAIRNGYTASTSGRNIGNQRIVSKSNTNAPSPLEETGGAARAEDVEQPKSRRKKHEKGEQPPQPLPERLLDVHLQSISTYFCDQSPKSSKTSFAWLFAEFSQRGFDDTSEEFAKLVNEARDKTNIAMRNNQIKGRNPDGSVAQMPYFFTILERDVDAWCKEYDALVQELGASRDESAEAPRPEEVALDSTGEEHELTHDWNRNSEYVEEQQLPPAPEDDVEVPVAVSLPQDDGQQPTPMLEVQEPILSSAHVEWSTEGGVIDTADPVDGWKHAKAAQYADHLCSYLDLDVYECLVLPTRCKWRYGFVVFERQNPANEWVYKEDMEVHRCIQQWLGNISET